MMFKNFLLLEGGAAVKGTQPVTQSEAKQILPDLIKHVSKILKIRLIDVKQIGSAGKKINDDDLSGDIDLAVRIDAVDVEKALKNLSSDGVSYRSMKGINVYSFAYDTGNKKIQVDLMPVSNMLYATWSLQANSEDLKEGLKGSHRNELFFAVAKHANTRIIKVDDLENPLIVKRYFYDLQRGLMEGVQTRESKRGSSKNFKTIEKKVITDDPVKIVKILFGEGVTPDDVSTFKGTIAAIDSNSFPNKAKRSAIIKMAKEGMKNKGLKIPDYF